ncbi:hypothetical protein L208DRAFT_1382282 [Tricholoma matsutake]|nr:hypothetical protein L208DRAFT_1382282 [Tricholoma matsutake 945]
MGKGEGDGPKYCEAKYLQHADIGERLIPMPATAPPPITAANKIQNSKMKTTNLESPFFAMGVGYGRRAMQTDAQYPTTQVANRGGPSAAMEPLPIKKRKVEWIDIPESQQSSPMANAEKDPGEIKDKLKEIEDMLLCPAWYPFLLELHGKSLGCLIPTWILDLTPLALLGYNLHLGPSHQTFPTSPPVLNMKKEPGFWSASLRVKGKKGRIHMTIYELFIYRSNGVDDAAGLLLDDDTVPYIPQWPVGSWNCDYMVKLNPDTFCCSAVHNYVSLHVVITFEYYGSWIASNSQLEHELQEAEGLFFQGEGAEMDTVNEPTTEEWAQIHEGGPLVVVAINMAFFFDAIPVWVVTNSQLERDLEDSDDGHDQHT